ncbi:MAG: invasin domain 3-containing protein [Trueperaceae bacterium]|nr:invasin domain 3-containing protein [Trueperaceae bacterium]
MRFRRNLSFGATVALAAWLVACGAPVEVPRVTDVAIVGGDRELEVGASVTLAVDVAAVGGADASVTWSSDLPAVAEVDAGGLVTARAVGTARITATSVATPSVSGSIAVSVVDPPPEPPGALASLTVVAGDGQTSVVGEAVPVRPAVRVRDADGRPVPGVAVRFTATAGGGSVTPSTPVASDADGVATLVSWNLGLTPGANALRARVDGSTPPIEVTFTATAVVGPPFADASTLTADPLQLPADGAATSALTVRLRDRYRNDVGIGGATVTFDPPTVGSIDAVVDGGDGSYTATYTAGTAEGDVVVTARLDGTELGDPVTLELTAVPVVDPPLPEPTKDLR